MKTKYLFFLFVSCLMARWANAQKDTIVSNEGDTIICKITRVSTEYIHFSVFDEGGMLLMRSRLPLESVRHYEQNTSTVSETPQNDNTPPAQPTEATRPNYLPRFKLSFIGGFTYQYEGYDGFPSSYARQLQTLWQAGAHFTYFPMEKVGFGLQYIYSFTGANADFEAPFPFSTIRDERVRFHQLGATLVLRREIYEDHMTHYFISGDIIYYRTDLEVDGIPTYEYGGTIGLSLGGSYDVKVSQNMAIGLGAFLTLGRITELVYDGNVVNVDFPISRLNISLSLSGFLR